MIVEVKNPKLNGFLISQGPGAPARAVLQVFNVAGFGAAGNGTTDDTGPIQKAIETASAAGGGVVYFPPGTYMATQITLKSRVLLDGGFVGAVTLQQIGGTNSDFVISDNFASLTGTGSAAPSVTTVPYFYGVKDLTIDGNRGEALALALTAAVSSDQLLLNHDFERWDAGTTVAPTRWTLTGAAATVARDATVIHTGTYAAAVTRAGTDCSINQDVATTFGPLNAYDAAPLTFGCWVYATVASRAQLRLADGVGTTDSAFHTGNSTWQWLTVTRTIDAAATGVVAHARVVGGDTTVRFDGAVLAAGSSLSSTVNRTGRGIAWYGNPMWMLGTVVVQNCADDNIYTETTSTPEQGSVYLEPGFFDTVYSINAGGKGWLYRGPHDGRIQDYLCVLSYTGDYGFYSENTATAGGQIDRCGQLHPYTYDDNTTNRDGVYLGASFTGDFIYADACACVIAAASCKVTQIDATSVGHRAAFDGLTVSGNAVQVGRISTATSTSATAGRTCVKWTGSNGYLGSLVATGDATVAHTGLEDTGSANHFAGLFVGNFSAASGVGIKLSSAGYCAYRGLISDCKTAMSYPSSVSQHHRVDLEVFTNTGQVAVSGATPSDNERFDIRESGVQQAATYTQRVSSNAIDMTITTVQTVTLAHQCLYTPTSRNVTLSAIVTAVTDFVWDQPPYFVSADGTNLTIKCKLGTASGTGGAKGDVMAHVRMGA